MTFLIDPALLIIFGYVSFVIGNALKHKTQLPISKALVIFSLCTIIFTSSSLYLNMGYVDFFWLPFMPAVTSGKDLMINSGIFSFESTTTTGLIDALAFLQIAIYPIWIYLGVKLYRYRHPEDL